MEAWKFRRRRRSQGRGSDGAIEPKRWLSIALKLRKLRGEAPVTDQLMPQACRHVGLQYGVLLELDVSRGDRG